MFDQTCPIAIVAITINCSTFYILLINKLSLFSNISQQPPCFIQQRRILKLPVVFTNYELPLNHIHSPACLC